MFSNYQNKMVDHLGNYSFQLSFFKRVYSTQKLTVYYVYKKKQIRIWFEPNRRVSIVDETS